MNQPLTIEIGRDQIEVTVGNEDFHVLVQAHAVAQVIHGSDQPPEHMVVFFVFPGFIHFHTQQPVFQIGGDNLPQSIDGGNASDAVSTNGLVVIAPLNKLNVLSEIELASSVLTPNGDGFNDGLQLSYSLNGVRTSKVEAAIHDLSGRIVHKMVDEIRGEGRYTEIWDGTVAGTTVAPGTYLVRVTVDTDLSTPFQSNLPDGQVVPPAQAAANLLAVIDSLEPGDSGKLFDWQGAEIPA